MEKTGAEKPGLEKADLRGLPEKVNCGLRKAVLAWADRLAPRI